MSAVLAGGVASATTLTLPCNIPERCQPLALTPPSATTLGPMLSMRVSVANCMSEMAMNDVNVLPNTASIARLNEAVAPSLALLDSVIQQGNPYWSAIAHDAKRDIFISMAVRERRSINGVNIHARDVLEPKLGAWNEAAAREHGAIAALENQHPGLGTSDPVIARAVADQPAQQQTAMR